MRYGNRSAAIKILAVLTALLLVFASFAACGKKADDAKQDTVKTEATEQDAAAEEPEPAAAEDEPAEPVAASDDANAPAATDNTPAKAAGDGTAPAKNAAQTPASDTAGKSSGSTPPVEKPAAKPADTPSDTVTVTLSVDCKLLYDDDPDLAALVSTKGVMLSGKSVTVKKGATVLDVLKASGVNYAGSAYIKSIMGLSEKDGGPKSGWCYSVNGKFPNLGVTKVTVGSGDKIAFRYSLNNGLEFGATL
jgi:predicted small lipoprotein YifL